MNILDLQDKLKNFSQDQLIREMQMPTGQLPQFLLLSEITRRKKMQDSYAQQQDQAQEQTTVAQDAINAAGIPQGEAQRLAGTMAPQTDMTGNTGAAPQQMMPQAPQPVQGMAGGGIVALQDGGRITAPRLVVRDGRQMLEMPDGSVVPLSRSQQAMLGRDLERDPQSMRYSNQPRADTDVAGMSMPSIGDVPTMAVPQLDQELARGQPNPVTMAMPGARPASVPPVAFADVAGMGAPSIGDVPAIARDTAPAASRQAPAIPAPLAQTEGDFPGLFMDPAIMAPADSSGGFRLVDPDAAPFESLERFLFPGRDPAEIRERRSDSRPALEPDTFQENFSMDGGTPAPAQPPVPDDVTVGPGEGLDPITSDELLPPAAPPAAPPAVTPPGPPGGGGIAAAARGAGAPSDFEQELMTMLAAREKRAEQDKWLALAQVGMQLMSSTQPTFGGALGEAGAAGLGALREGQAGSEADRLALLGQIEQSRMGRERLDLERQALAARQAASGDGKPIPASVLTAVNSQIADLQSQLPMVMNNPVQRDAIEQEIRRLNTIANQVLSTYGLGAGVAEDAQPDFVTQ